MMSRHRPNPADQRSRRSSALLVGGRIGGAALAWSLGLLACSGLLWLWGDVLLTKTGQALSSPRASAPHGSADLGAEPNHREALLREMRLLSRPPHRNGWSAGIRNLARRPMSALKGDLDFQRAVRAEVAAAEVGIDAWQVRGFPSFGAFFVTTDRDGVRLLLGGVLDGRHMPHARIVLDGVTPLGSILESGMGPVAFREDGTPVQLLAHAGRGGEPDRLELIDLIQRKPIHRFELHSRLVLEYFHELGLAPDAAVVGTPIRNDDGQVRLQIWDAETGRGLHRLDFPGRCMAFTPRRSLVAAGDDAGRVRVWSLATGQPVASFGAAGTPIRRLVFGADTLLPADRGVAPGWLLAIVDASGTIAIRAVRPRARSEGTDAWAEDTSPPRALSKISNREVTAVGFSPDRTLLAACDLREAHLFDAATGKRLLSLEAGAGLQCLTFAPRGGYLAFSTAGEGEPGTTSIWSIRDHGAIRLLRGLTGRVVETTISPDPGGARVAAYGAEGEIGVWNRQSNSLRFVLPVSGGLGAGRVALAFSPDGSRLAYAGRGEARLWDAAGGRELGRWALPAAPAGNEAPRIALAYPSDAELLLYRPEALAAGPGVIRIRNLLGPDPLKPLAEIADLASVRVAAVGRDGAIYVAEGFGVGTGPGGTAGAPGHVVNGYSGKTGRRLWSVPSTRPTVIEGDLRLDPGGSVLASASPSPSTPFAPASLIDATTGASRGSLTPNPLGLGPAARRWTSWAEGEAGGLTFHDRDREEPLFSLPPQVIPGPPAGVSFNPDGTYASWGNPDGTVAVCDLPEIDRRLLEAGSGW